MGKILFLLFTFCFLLASSAWGATYWVDPSGKDSNSCASIRGASDPRTYKKSITAGIGCLSGSDTLIVKDGTYVENVTAVPPSGTPSNKTTIKAENSRRAIIKPASRMAVDWENNSNIRLEGLVVDMDDSNGTGIRLARYTSMSNIEIVDMEIKNTDGGISCLNLRNNLDGFLVQDTYIHDCYGLIPNPGTHGIYMSARNGIVERTTIHSTSGFCSQNWNNKGSVVDNVTYRYNLFYDCGSSGNPQGALVIAKGTGTLVHNNVIRDSSGATGGIILFATGDNAEIYNNTIYNNRAGGISIKSGSDNHIIKNNIVLDNGGRQISDSGTGNTISNNLTTGKATDIFTNPAGGDLTLKAGSPAIDAGAVIKGFAFNGAAPDMGAYETNVDSLNVPSSPDKLQVLK